MSLPSTHGWICTNLMPSSLPLFNYQNSPGAISINYPPKDRVHKHLILSMISWMLHFALCTLCRCLLILLPPLCAAKRTVIFFKVKEKRMAPVLASHTPTLLPPSCGAETGEKYVWYVHLYILYIWFPKSKSPTRIPDKSKNKFEKHLQDPNKDVPFDTR